MYDLMSLQIQYLKGIGPQRAFILANDAGIKCVSDLLYYFPNKYVDRSRIYKIRELTDGMPTIQIIGKLKGYQEEGRGRKSRLEAWVYDDTGQIKLVWFGGIVGLKKRLKQNAEYLVFGKPSMFNHEVQVVQPEMTEMSPHTNLQSIAKLRPVYSLSERMRNSGITSSVIEQMVEQVWEKVTNNDIEETFPEYFLAKYNLMGLCEALHNIHSPEDMLVLAQAERRLKFEELFYVQLSILSMADERTRKFRGFVFPKVGDYFMRFYNEFLPFALTDAQKRVIKEIRSDLKSGLQMNRLLQGDVGSGKTMVAFMSMLIAIDNGYQTCIMAPTEILAKQHYYNALKVLGGLGLNIELLTGGVVGKKRTSILDRVQSGEVNVLVGTHALLNDQVLFQRLGIAVIDEQHRFGVEQRAKLWTKNDSPPHILVMTATPIPRTLAMTLYGDLKVSVIDELPPGRKVVKTVHCYEENIASVFNLVKRELTKGRQAYFVYPLIEESEKTDMKDLENGFNMLSEVFKDYVVCKLHGKMKDDEKNHVMESFKKKESQILVSTTVIEVGVDVPNASVMVIVNSNRFGLAQLHQLRGRVGRGAEQSYCVLMTPFELGEISRKRIEIMVDSNDGFYIAEEDLKLRGPGVLDGTKQSGVPFDLKIANVIRDSYLLEEARRVAQYVVEQDPERQLSCNTIIWKQLTKKQKTSVNLSNIS